MKQFKIKSIDINKVLSSTKFVKKKKYDSFLISSVSNLEEAKKGAITFYDNFKYELDLKNTKASFCIIREKDLKKLSNNTIPIISSNPLIDFILIAKSFYPNLCNDDYNFKQNKKYKNFTKKNTYIDSSVKIGSKFKIGFNSLIKNNVVIGNNVTIGSNCVISNCLIKDNVTINDGSIIGKIGYGFKLIDKKLEFIPHLGLVILSEGVYIGSNCTIDRGSFSNTVIGKNTMIDNLVHIAHNVKIGSFCFIAGQVGIAGSTKIESNCMIGGQAGISGHLKIGNNVQIAGHSGVLKNISDNSKVIGFPAVNIKEFIKRSKLNDKQ